MVSSLYKTASYMLKLLSRLNEQIIARRHPHWDAFARVACPDIQARIARPSVDGQEVQICVEAGEDGVEGAVLGEVGGGGGEEVGTVCSGWSAFMGLCG